MVKEIEQEPQVCMVCGRPAIKLKTNGTPVCAIHDDGGNDGSGCGSSDGKDSDSPSSGDTSDNAKEVAAPHNLTATIPGIIPGIADWFNVENDEDDEEEEEEELYVMKNREQMEDDYVRWATIDAVGNDRSYELE